MVLKNRTFSVLSNLNRAYKAVMRNKGCGGINKMSCEQLLPWLMTNKDVLIRSLMDGSYRPNPVKRVKYPKTTARCACWEYLQ